MKTIQETESSIKAYKNPLIDEELQLNINVFQNIKPSTLSSWSEIEMWCAINGIEPNEDLFKFLLIGMNLYTNIYELVFKELETSDSLDMFINKLESIELIYKVTNADFLNWNIITEWIRVFGPISNDTNSEIYQIMSELEQRDPLEFKYRVFSAIDRRFPLLLIQFYDKHKTMLYQHDSTFIRYLFKRMKHKAAQNQAFDRIYSIMCRERDDHLRISMFLG